MSDHKEDQPKFSGLEDKSLDELRQMWDAADQTGVINGYSQGEIHQEISKRVQSEIPPVEEQ